MRIGHSKMPKQTTNLCIDVMFNRTVYAKAKIYVITKALNRRPPEPVP
jgi:hypothetical protein